MIKNIFISCLFLLFLSFVFSAVFEFEPAGFIIQNAFAEEEKPEETVPELDEKDYFSNPHYDLEERHFNEGERNFNEPDKYDYYEPFDEKESPEYR